MRLTAISLSGFKSFCDRATVAVREGLTGVVGPNGCGKSNIVDALRWCLGESRAAQLRGGALQDVLFNGSGGRPPGDWCMVETRFAADKNDDLGMWSGCAEIAVKRELGRDGQSYFYINGRTVRRRDVVSLFHGTGVSPRSYAVVEQGMVGAIAEASAEELRRFLEETAGVSHYKDRRRDAERRLASCRANLEQTAQLMEDARRRQESLKRQARAARRYRELSDSINDLEVLLILQNREIAENKLAEKNDEISVLDGKIGELQTQCDSLRDATEEARTRREEWRQKMQTHETHLARATDAARRIREDYEQAEQKRARLRERTDAEKTEYAEAEESAKQCAAELQTTNDELHAAGGGLEKCAAEFARKSEELARCQESLRAAEGEKETANRRLQEIEQRRATIQIETQMAEERRAAIQSRLDKLREATAKKDADSPPPSAADAEKQVARREEELRAAEAVCKQAETEAEKARAALRESENAHIAAAAERDALHSMAAKHEWKSRDIPPRLSEMLRAEAGEWSRALDAALGRFADGYAVPSLDDFLRDNGLPPAGAGIVEMRAAAENFAPPQNRTPLLSFVKAPRAAAAFLAARLRGVYAAEDAETARKTRGDLAEGEMSVTREGAVFMKNAVFVAGEVRGGFDWQRRLSALEESLAGYAENLRNAQRRTDENLQTRMQSEIARVDAAAALTAARAELSERRIAFGQWEERRRAAESRREEMRGETEIAAAELRRLEKENARRAGADDLQTDYDEAAAAAESAKSSAAEAARTLELRRGECGQSEMTLRELRLRRENLGRQKESLAARAAELARRQKTLSVRIAQGAAEIAQFAESALDDAMARHAADIKAAEKMLQKTAAEESEWARKISAADGERESRLRELQSAREKNTALQVEKRELSLSLEGLDNSLEDFVRDETRLAPLREKSAPPEERREEIAALRGRRDRLGAINFAAEQELSEGEARLEEMRAQRDDVESAADELQKTIRRIDDETRARLREVYEAINREFGGLFQRLFGGGEAELAMDGDSFLDAEFEIRARPPGKRMFPVRMLSGGEKSATALAFIFTLMRHTPPPFCIMDEVDATLDDARSDSFVALLGEMSQHFQCLVVTHNKNTIESARHLVGVTQEEKGVSKIVSVTRAEAARAASS
ncbi:MAG: chromosome segregation protein SMC [Gammaproteobacteria bacterium]